MDDATAALDALLARIATGKADLKTSEAALRAAITSSLAVRRRTEIAGPENTPNVQTLMRTPDGTLIAAGREYLAGDAKILLLRSVNGVDWTPIRPEAVGKRLARQINALIAAPDGTLIAVGGR